MYGQSLQEQKVNCIISIKQSEIAVWHWEVKNCNSNKNKDNQNTQKWKELSGYWSSRFNTMKMATLSKSIYRVSVVSVKIPGH